MIGKLPPLFDGIIDVDVYAALRHFARRRVAPGDVIVAQGEPADSLLCVVEGELAIRAGATELGVARAGDVVGEMALFEDSTRSASVIAATDAELLVLTRDGYEKLRDVVHPLAQAVELRALQLQVRRLRGVGDRIAELASGQPLAYRRPSDVFFAAVTSLFGRGGRFSTERVDPLPGMRKNPLFADAPEDALVRIAAELTAQAWGPGAFLCTEGEVGDAMYLLEDGDVDVVVATEADRVEHLVTLHRGAAFGMVSLAEDAPRMSSCIAKTRVVVQRLGKDGWERLVREPFLAGTVFRRAMIRAISEQLAYSNGQLQAYERKGLDYGTLLRASAGVEAHGPFVRRS